MPYIVATGIYKRGSSRLGGWSSSRYRARLYWYLYDEYRVRVIRDRFIESLVTRGRVGRSYPYVLATSDPYHIGD